MLFRSGLEPTVVEADPPLGMDLSSGAIRSILWCTGYSPDYSWPDVPVPDRKGRTRHDGGVGTVRGTRRRQLKPPE